MTVQEFFDGLANGATWSAGVAFKRSNPLPIDSNSVFASTTELTNYLETNPVAYPGQVVAVATNDSVTVYGVKYNTTSAKLEPVALATSETSADISELQSKVFALETWQSSVTTTIEGAEQTSNRVVSISSSSDDLHYPTAKAVYDTIQSSKSDVIVDSDVEQSLSGTAGKIPDSSAVKTVTDAIAGDVSALELAVSGLTEAADDYVLKTDVETILSGTSGKIPNSTAVQTAINTVDAAAEKLVNKVTSFNSPSDTQYPSAKLVYDQLATKLEDASSDDKIYGRQNGAWVEVDVADPTLDEVLIAGAEATDKSITLKDTAGTSSTVVDVSKISFVAPSKSFSIDVSASAVSGDETLKGSFRTWLNVDNVTNESKATMFTNPTFTGTVTIPEPVNDSDAATKKYVDDAIDAIPEVVTPNLNAVVAAGNTVTGAGGESTTLAAGSISFSNTGGTNTFSVNVNTPEVTGSDDVKDAFINWLGVGLVYRYTA